MAKDNKEKSKEKSAKNSKKGKNGATPEAKLIEADSATIVASSTAGTNEANDVTSKRKKRQLRATPSTVREQSEQAADRAGQPTKRRRGINLIGGIIAVPFRLIAWPFRQLARIKPFRWLFKGIGYVLAPPYIRNAFKELRLVTWPTTKQSRQLTSAVIIFSLIFGTLAAITDYGINALFRHVILKH